MQKNKILILIVLSFFFSCFLYIILKPTKRFNSCIGLCQNNYDVYYKANNISQINTLLNDNNKIINDLKKTKHLDIVINDVELVCPLVNPNQVLFKVDNIIGFIDNFSIKDVNIYFGKIQNKYLLRKIIIKCKKDYLNCYFG